MHTKKWNSHLFLVGFLCLCCLLCACESSSVTETSLAANQQTEFQQAEAPDVTGSFEISILQVGKADALVLHSETGTVLIDCGEKGDGKDVLAYLEELGVEKVDYLFITHFDQDHVGGVTKVLHNMPVDQIVTPKYEGSNEEYKKYQATVSELGITPLELTENMTFTLDDVLYEVYPPEKSHYAESDNDYSLAISVTHGENTFLFAGDAESERLMELSTQMDLSHTFLKVPHHGVIDKRTEEFVAAVSPTYAVITDSEKHPADSKTLYQLESVGCTTYETKNGTIHVASDGSTLSISQDPSK
jgi:beta-lactamase superfamily II metal-dependent hydrolase